MTLFRTIALYTYHNAADWIALAFFVLMASIGAAQLWRDASQPVDTGHAAYIGLRGTQ